MIFWNGVPPVLYRHQCSLLWLVLRYDVLSPVLQSLLCSNIEGQVGQSLSTEIHQIFVFVLFQVCIVHHGVDVLNLLTLAFGAAALGFCGFSFCFSIQFVLGEWILFSSHFFSISYGRSLCSFHHYIIKDDVLIEIGFLFGDSPCSENLSQPCFRWRESTK